VMLYGKGAGSMAAASAVVSDVTYLARQVAAGTAGKLPYVSNEHRKHLKPILKADIRTRYYLRFTAVDRAGVLSGISGILGKHDVSISGVYQPEHTFDEGPGVPILILTHKAREGAIEKALKEISRKSYLRAKTVLLRIEE
jgi:homoserine dehydrogenase